MYVSTRNYQTPREGGADECTVFRFADDIDPQRVECPDIGNDQDQLRLNWLSCIRTREPAISGTELATKIMVIVDLATRSAWEGHAYTFDPTTMRARQA